MRQSGYTALLVLLLLFGASGVWIASMGLPDSQSESAAMLEVNQARVALIAYAIDYMNHYGARGAGPGHLPCPDTDPPSNTSIHHEWHLDGPNPPCADEAVEFGWLPRHVSTKIGRYHFHQRARQRLLYAVSGAFINNPVNRVVNVSTRGNLPMRDFEDVVAIVAATTPGLSGRGEQDWWKNPVTNNNIRAFALIRSADLQASIRDWIARWLVSELNETLSSQCKNTESVSAGSESIVESIVESVVKPVVEPVDKQPPDTLADELLWCEQLAASIDQCQHSDSLLLLAWLAATRPHDGCSQSDEISLINTAFLESVPLRQHWFFRNQWHRYVSLTIHPRCEESSVTLCTFSLPKETDFYLIDNQRIHLRLAPINSE